MRKKKQSKFPAKYVLLIMTILCAVIIGCSLKTSGSKGSQPAWERTDKPAGASADKEKSGKRK